MSLIDDEGVIGTKLGISLSLGKQDAISHQLDGGALTGLVSKTHLITHVLADGSAQLLGYALRCGCRSDTARLCMSNEAAAVDSAPTKVQTDLR